jgi:SPP1 gp7 family putative phage head morphogenesis protein
MLDPATGLIRFDRTSPDRFLRPYAADMRSYGAPVLRAKKTLKATRPNLGIEAAYRRELLALIDEMHKSVGYWIKAKFKANEPRIAEAQDATPADALRVAVSRLAKRWQSRFDDAAGKLADYFARAVEERSTASLKKILKDSGFSVKFQMTPVMNDIFDATVNQNVALIKSIGSQYLGDVEGMVQRSIQSGRDIKGLTNELEQRYGITRRRAELIARDQNNKAQSAFTRARRIECGITQAVWMHSHGGETPRPSHVALNGKLFDVAKGAWDVTEQKWIQPGELVNCKCVSRPVVAGFQ